MTNLIDYLRLESPCDQGHLPTASEGAHPFGVSHPMRKKLQIWRRTPRRIPVKRRENLFKKRALRRNLARRRKRNQWRRKTIKKILARRRRNQ